MESRSPEINLVFRDQKRRRRRRRRRWWFKEGSVGRMDTSCTLITRVQCAGRSKQGARGPAAACVQGREHPAYGSAEVSVLAPSPSIILCKQHLPHYLCTFYRPMDRFLTTFGTLDTLPCNPCAFYCAIEQRQANISRGGGVLANCKLVLHCL